jgi:succinate dehydrogenase / fumarate reductase, flavoprotein subunit
VVRQQAGLPPSEVKAGRGSPHGGVYLDIASRRSADDIRRRLPSMYHQFKELADVDITTDPMEIGPTCHYIMGGVRVEADTAVTTVAGLYAAGEVAAGMHGANRLGGNSLSDLLVFGRRAGLAAAERALGLSGEVTLDQLEVEDACMHALSFFDHDSGENPYAVHAALQDTMQDLVGIIRTEGELVTAAENLKAFDERITHVAVEGNRQFNPGWHTALDMESMLSLSHATTLSAIERKESRGGHTRDDFPLPDPRWGSVNLASYVENGVVKVKETPLPEMPDDLKELFEEGH